MYLLTSSKERCIASSILAFVAGMASLSNTGTASNETGRHKSHKTTDAEYKSNYVQKPFGLWAFLFVPIFTHH